MIPSGTELVFVTRNHKMAEVPEVFSLTGLIACGGCTLLELLWSSLSLSCWFLIVFLVLSACLIMVLYCVFLCCFLGYVVVVSAVVPSLLPTTYWGKVIRSFLTTHSQDCSHGTASLCVVLVLFLSLRHGWRQTVRQTDRQEDRMTDPTLITLTDR